MGKKASFKGKKQYAAYASQNREQKNKIRKLKKEIKRSTVDGECKNKQALSALARIEKGDYTRRSAPTRRGGRIDMIDVQFFEREKTLAMEKVEKARNAKDKEKAKAHLAAVSAKKPRSANLLSGRISADGKKMQQYIRQDRKLRNILATGDGDKLFPKPIKVEQVPGFTDEETRDKFMEIHKANQPRRKKRYNKKKAS